MSLSVANPALLFLEARSDALLNVKTSDADQPDLFSSVYFMEPTVFLASGPQQQEVTNPSSRLLLKESADELENSLEIEEISDEDGDLEKKRKYKL